MISSNYLTFSRFCLRIILVALQVKGNQGTTKYGKCVLCVCICGNARLLEYRKRSLCFTLKNPNALSKMQTADCIPNYIGYIKPSDFID